MHLSTTLIAFVIGNLLSLLTRIICEEGWPEPYIYTVYDRIYGEFPAKSTVYTPYIYGSGQPYLWAIQMHYSRAAVIFRLALQQHYSLRHSSAAACTTAERRWYPGLPCCGAANCFTTCAGSIVITVNLLYYCITPILLRARRMGDGVKLPFAHRPGLVHYSSIQHTQMLLEASLAWMRSINPSE